MFGRKSQKQKEKDKQIFAEKVLPKAVMAGINTSQFGKLFVKFVDKSSEANEIQSANADNISSNIDMMNQQNATSMNKLSSSLGKMNSVQAKKLDNAVATAQENYNKQQQSVKLQNQKLELYPEIIKKGLTLYFSNAVLNAKTGKFEVQNPDASAQQQNLTQSSNNYDWLTYLTYFPGFAGFAATQIINNVK